MFIHQRLYLGRKLIFHFFYLQLLCIKCIIMKVSKPRQELLKNLVLFLVCLQWELKVLKRFQIFQVALRCFNYIFIKTKV